MNKLKRVTILKRLQAQLPHPTTELRFNSSFELLISVMLSAQATDIGVNKATEKLYLVANTPQAILALGFEDLKSYIQTINFYNTKAKHVIKACELLIERHQGEVPNTREALESLPGVGRKTANVILNTAFGHPTLAVDTHIFRVANRTKIAIGKTPLEVELNLLKVIPPAYLYNAHHWLLLHGRYMCKAKKPYCSECIISDLCEWEHKSAY